MMTHAYSAAYLSNAKELLSSFFDYAINDCKLSRIGSQHCLSTQVMPSSSNAAILLISQACPAWNLPVLSS